MQAKQFLLAAAAALVATSGFAVEATQYVPEAGTLARAEVRAERDRALADGSISERNETYGSADATPSVRERAEVRAEARMAARTRTAQSLYIGG